MRWGWGVVVKIVKGSRGERTRLLRDRKAEREGLHNFPFGKGSGPGG